MASTPVTAVCSGTRRAESAFSRRHRDDRVAVILEAMTQPAQAVLPRITPIAPSLRPQAFNGPAWLFEPNYDGFRGVVYLTGGRCSIYSKRGNKFSRFSELE